MILPIGHESQEVRRLPWVTFFILAACLVTHIMVSKSMSRLNTQIRQSATRMLRYWIAHPYLELDPAFTEEMGIDESDLEKLEAMMPQSTSPEDDREFDRQQRELDAMTDQLLKLRLNAPYYRWGLVPKRVGLPGLFTHMFIHGGWLHLIGNLLFLYLTGPFVEDLWGRWLYGVFYIAVGIVSGLMFCLHYPHSTSALIGASGAIAGVMGAFLIYFWKTRIRFAFFLGILYTGTFKAPAWVMLPLWAGLELMNAGTMDKITGGRGGGVAHWAHVWGFVFGFCIAGLLKLTGFVDKRIAPALEQETSLRNPGLEAYEEGLKHLDKGRFPEARDCFVKALRAHPEDLDILEYLELATRSTGEPEVYREYAARAMETHLRRGDTVAGLGLFQRLRQDTPLDALPTRTCAMLVPPLLEAGDPGGARVLLEQVIDHAGPEIPAGLVITLVEPARLLGERLAGRLGALVAARPDIPESVKQSLNTPFSHPDSDGETPPGRRRRDVRITRVTPVRLGADRLVLRMRDGSEKALELSRVHSLGVAAISGRDHSPLILIDLFMDDPAPDTGTLRIVRLASNGFDPRPLVAPHASISQAFSVLIHSLLERSRAIPWPDAGLLDISRIPRHPDPASYQRLLEGDQD